MKKPWDSSKNFFDKYIDSILKCLTNRLKCQNVELLTHTVKVLATYGWNKTEDASFGYDAIAYFKTRFSLPLEHANVDSSLLQQKWDGMVDYTKMYINLTENYRKVWWKLFNNSDNNRWSNILSLVELLLDKTYQFRSDCSHYSQSSKFNCGSSSSSESNMIDADWEEQDFDE